MLLIRPPVSTILDQLARRLAKAPAALRRRALDCAPTPMTHDVWWQATDAILALRGLPCPAREAVGALAGDRQSSLRTCQQPVVAILNNIVELPRPFSNVDLYALVSDMLSLPFRSPNVLRFG
ncbi:MAG: hypothetical protein IPJ34_40875 [Myxococcales bacterium]|nr:hypothetical protein [Myxococcales bacterium]